MSEERSTHPAPSTGHSGPGGQQGGTSAAEVKAWSWNRFWIPLLAALAVGLALLVAFALLDLIRCWRGFPPMLPFCCPPAVVPVVLQDPPDVPQRVTVDSPAQVPAPAPSPQADLAQVAQIHADHVILTYEFHDGWDLDMAVAVLRPDVSAPSVGYGQDSTISIGGRTLCRWSGDNTGVGVESVHIDVGQLLEAAPGVAELVIRCNGFWFRRPGSQPVRVLASLYQGGTVGQPVSFQFECVGAARTADVASREIYLPMTVARSAAGSTPMAFLVIDIAKGEVRFEEPDWTPPGNH